jgi:broad specificity phosphatase PhoE
MAENRLVVVRHGETEWAAQGRHTSVTEQQLTVVGEAQAKALHGPLSRYDFALVLTSPRQRSLRTCELAGFGDRAVVEENLAEWFYGDYEGMTRTEIQAVHPGWAIWRDGVPGGERLSHVASRADRVISRVLEADGDVLAFTHGHFSRVLGARWCQLHPELGRIIYVDPAGVSELAWHDGRRVIHRWNMSSPVED